jgi:hypothetical protein
MSEADDAKAAYTRFIGPAIDAIATDVTKRMMKIAVDAPSKEGEIKWMAMTLSNLHAVQSHIGLIIADGAIEQSQREHAAMIAKMSPERKKILGII